MPIILVVALLLAEAVILVVALFIMYKLQIRPKAKTTIAAKRKDTPGWIYEFIDPDTGDVVYVGQSAQVEKRIEHYLQVATSTGLIYVWLAEKIQQGKKPVVRIVAPGKNKDELNRLEQDRINAHITAGIKLLNRQSVKPASRIARYVTVEKLED
jgi:hypothetical protein